VKGFIHGEDHARRTYHGLKEHGGIAMKPRMHFEWRYDDPLHGDHVRTYWTRGKWRSDSFHTAIIILTRFVAEDYNETIEVEYVNGDRSDLRPNNIRRLEGSPGR
jgi:hypothetical protein